MNMAESTPAAEWKIEQGLPGNHEPFGMVDQTLDEEHQANDAYDQLAEVDDLDEVLESVKHIKLEDVQADAVFAEEKEGWHGYIEWENCPEKRAIAHKILLSRNSLIRQSFSWPQFQTPILYLKVYGGRCGTGPLVDH